jgi:hypothetical protein
MGVTSAASERNESSTVAFPLHQGSPIRVFAGAVSFNDAEVRWPGDAKSIYVRVRVNEESWLEPRENVCLVSAQGKPMAEETCQRVRSRNRQGSRSSLAERLRLPGPDTRDLCIRAHDGTA